MKGNNQQQRTMDMFYRYKDKVNQYGKLTAREEQELWDRAEKDDKKALDTIIESCLRYVCGLGGYDVSSLEEKGINVLDAIGEGNLALMKAIQKYDRTKGCRFYSYALYAVKGAISRMVQNNPKQKESKNIDIDRLQDNDDNTLFDEDDSWRRNLPDRIQNYLDQRYYPGAGRLFLNTMQLTTEGLSLMEAAAKQNVTADFIKRIIVVR